jgi:hypothetical protein
VIRITYRNPNGSEREVKEYPSVPDPGRAPIKLGLRFERELVTLAADGVPLGLTRWSEAVYRVRKVQEVIERESFRLAQIHQGDDEQFWLSLADFVPTVPDYGMAQVVLWWVAVNMVEPLTLSELVDISQDDIEDEPDIPDYPDEDGAEGKDLTG